MSDDEETYCRLCAEPTPKTQLIFPDEDVAINSKVIKKMLWINVVISNTDRLPNGICFSCFDQLERTWQFLQTVRTAQQKLQTVFGKKQDETVLTDIKHDEVISDAGKPVNENWDEFQENKEIKYEIPIQNLEAIATVDPSSLLCEIGEVKIEQGSDTEMLYSNIGSDGFHSTDSDVPLQFTVKKKMRKKKKIKYRSPSLHSVVIKVEEQIDISKLCMTWENYMCRCAVCDAVCENIMSLRLHSLQIHSSCCLFKCSDCSKVIASYKAFVNHVRLHKRLLRYCCEFCNKQFTTSSYLKKHQNGEHSEAISLGCHNCGALFETKEQLQNHITQYAKWKQRKRDPETELKCDCCNKEFKSRSNLQQHKLVHTERSRNFSCHVCGKMFFTKGTLCTHMLIHEDTKPYKCEFCPMAFRASGNLRSHITLHSGGKPFVCEQCGKSFRVKRHLKSHSIVHTDLMPYVCEYCKKPFRFKTRLNLHLRQHTGLKPYNCVLCQRDFTNGSNYKKHMKRRHDIDTSRRKFNNVSDEQDHNREKS